MSEEMQTLLFAACLDLFKLNPACLSHFELALLGAHALFCILARGCSVRRASLRTSNQTLISYHTLPKDLHTRKMDSKPESETKCQVCVLSFH
jgi:hypothetical protein